MKILLQPHIHNGALKKLAEVYYNYDELSVPMYVFVYTDLMC